MLLEQSTQYIMVMNDNSLAGHTSGVYKMGVFILEKV